MFGAIILYSCLYYVTFCVLGSIRHFYYTGYTQVQLDNVMYKECDILYDTH